MLKFNKFEGVQILKPATILSILLLLTCVGIVFLENTPSTYSHFLATIEAKTIRFRTGGQITILEGIGGSAITLRDLSDNSVVSFDLKQKSKQESKPLMRKTLNSNSYVEVDAAVVPENSVVDLVRRTDVSGLEIEIDGEALPLSVRIVWSGAVQDENGLSQKNLTGVEWSGRRTLVMIEDAQVDALMPVPTSITSIDFSQTKYVNSKPITINTLTSGKISFDTFQYPTKEISIRETEWLEFDGVSARIMKLDLTKNGFRVVLMGVAKKIQAGFLQNRRDIRPSLLSALAARPEVSLLTSLIIGFIFAVVGTIAWVTNKN